MRLSKITHVIVNPSQGGRQGTEYQNLLMQIRETTQVLKSMKNNKVAVMTIDVPNGFDILKLEFLVAVMGKLKFPRTFIKLKELLLEFRVMKLQIR